MLHANEGVTAGAGAVDELHVAALKLEGGEAWDLLALKDEERGRIPVPQVLPTGGPTEAAFLAAQSLPFGKLARKFRERIAAVAQPFRHEGFRMVREKGELVQHRAFLRFRSCLGAGLDSGGQLARFHDVGRRLERHRRVDGRRRLRVCVAGSGPSQI